jgi:hypothetical protein
VRSSSTRGRRSSRSCFLRAAQATVETAAPPRDRSSPMGGSTPSRLLRGTNATLAPRTTRVWPSGTRRTLDEPNPTGYQLETPRPAGARMPGPVRPPMKCPARERQTDTPRRSCVQTRAGTSAVKAGATALDEIQSCAGLRRPRSCICGRARPPAIAPASMHHTSVAAPASTGTSGFARVVWDVIRRITSKTAGALEPDRVPWASSERRRCHARSSRE